MHARSASKRFRTTTGTAKPSCGPTKCSLTTFTTAHTSPERMKRSAASTSSSPMACFSTSKSPISRKCSSSHTALRKEKNSTARPMASSCTKTLSPTTAMAARRASNQSPGCSNTSCKSMNSLPKRAILFSLAGLTVLSTRKAEELSNKHAGEEVACAYRISTGKTLTMDKTGKRPNRVVRLPHFSSMKILAKWRKSRGHRAGKR